MIKKVAILVNGGDVSGLNPVIRAIMELNVMVLLMDTKAYLKTIL